MRNQKHCMARFAFYDRTGIQAFLEKQAAQGWMLEDIGNFGWKFRRTEPQQLRFAVVYFPKADMYDPEPGEAEQTFREFCAHGGWILAASSAQMQIFYTKGEESIPIETDPVMEVENIHKSMKKSVLPACWLMLVFLVLLLVLAVIGYRASMIRYLSDSGMLLAVVCCAAMLMMDIWQMGSYYRWYRRAQKTAEAEGIFLETRSTSRGETVAAVVVLICLVGLLLPGQDWRRAADVWIDLAVYLTMIVLIGLFRGKLKREGYDAQTGRTAALIACMVLAIVLSLFVKPLAHAAADSFREQEAVRLPLTIEDLRGADDLEYTNLMLYDQESLLLGYQDAFQAPSDTGIDMRLEYEIVDVKVPFLYRGCLEELMQIPAHITQGHYEETDPAPWGAERAWQLYEGRKPRSWYVLCYEDTILEIIPSWEMTVAQMAVVGEILRGGSVS